jgi:hypothetical protein
VSAAQREVPPQAAPPGEVAAPPTLGARAAPLP